MWGLNLISAKNARRLRCSVAVFVCWALLAACSLIVYLVIFLVPTPNTRLDINLNVTWYKRRLEWQAFDPDYDMRVLRLPVQMVVIAHSVTPFCTSLSSCINNVRSIQMNDIIRGWGDIGPNFLVGGNGLIFEGRGANVRGEMLPGWDSESISIVFLGDYTRDNTTQEQFDNTNVLLNVLVSQNILRRSYAVFGRCQLETITINPGFGIMENMNNFTNWNPTNANRCLRGT